MVFSRSSSKARVRFPVGAQLEILGQGAKILKDTSVSEHSEGIEFKRFWFVCLLV